MLILLAKRKTMKYFFTAAFVFTAFISSAQLQKGSWNIGTSTNAPFNLQLSSNGPGFKSYNFSFNPTVGYFLQKRWEVGGGPMFSFSGNRYKDISGNTSLKNNKESAGISVYTRYYLKDEGKLLPYLTANTMYLRTSGYSTDLSGLKSKYRLNEWQVGGGAGLNWFITPKASLFTELNYTGNWGGGSGYINGLNLKMGFQIHLGKRKSKR